MIVATTCSRVRRSPLELAASKTGNIRCATESRVPNA